jgi:hypothetical protein
MTTFLRLIQAGADEKGEALADAAARWRSGSELHGIFEVEPLSFGMVPGSPFAYWVNERVRKLFVECPVLADLGVTGHSGASTMADFRHIRGWWEVSPGKIGFSREETRKGQRWVSLAKGGEYSPYYYDLDLVVDWYDDGRIMKTTVSEYRGSRGWGYGWSAAINGHSEYFKRGFTWPRRTTSGFSLRILPPGCIFGDKGPAISGGPELWLLALMNSAAYEGLLKLQLAAGDAAARSYEVGLVERTPLPPNAETEATLLANRAAQAWLLRRRESASAAVSHAFTLPALLRTSGDTLAARAEAWSSQRVETQDKLARIQAEIDEVAFRLYGIDGEDRRQLEQGFGSLGSSVDEVDEDSDDEAADEGSEAAGLVGLIEALLEWTMGVALGRFDVRLATNQSLPPADPDPFDPLPVCSPGMLQDEAGIPATEAPPGYPLELPLHGILVDDPGHPWDVVTRMEAVLDFVAGEHAPGWIHEAEAILGRGLRDWLRRYGFERHLKRYSRSRRKAPLFWHLTPKSREYGIWLYSPVATRDTLYRVLNDYLDPRLKAAERRLFELRQQAGESPTGQQRRDLMAQESLVEELRAFREEVARAAPLWVPHRDDGVVLNCAVLWRLFGHHRAWQSECRSKWGELAKGKYDWAGWAMHLWPERVVRGCAADRSIAIAHGLEEALWEQDGDGKWEPRSDADEQVARLAAERRSPAIQAALDDFIRAG